MNFQHLSVAEKDVLKRSKDLEEEETGRAENPIVLEQGNDDVGLEVVTDTLDLGDKEANDGEEETDADVQVEQMEHIPKCPESVQLHILEEQMSPR